MNLTFYPGPSKLYPQVGRYLTDAYESGLLSMNHRSTAFMEMLSRAIADLRIKLEIPEEYEVYLTSSATECWEIIAQSLVSTHSLHLYNGAFGQKWFDYTRKLRPASQGLTFGLNELPDLESSPDLAAPEVLCLTHNETSNGTALPDQMLHRIRGRYPGIIAVDATSSMGGIALPWLAADAWYASVQKCFGLPPGLGVMVVSPRAIDHAERLGDRKHYNSLLFLRENFLTNQTPYTPNSLGIYLLGRVMQDVLPITHLNTLLNERASELADFLVRHNYRLLVENPQVRSATVLAIQAEAGKVRSIKQEALAQGIILGNGYGPWKDTTLRIANFPALTEQDFSKLKLFLGSRS